MALSHFHVRPYTVKCDETLALLVCVCICVCVCVHGSERQ